MAAELKSLPLVQATDTGSRGQSAAAPAVSTEDGLLATLVVLVVLTVGQKLVGFLRSLLICRLLPPEELGTWAMMNTIILTATPLVLLSIPACFGRYCESFRTRGQLRAFIRQASLICGTGMVVGVALLLVFRTPVAALTLGTADLGWVVAYCSLALVPFAAFAFSMELILSLRLGRHATYANFLSTAILAVASLLLLTLWQATALAMLAAFAIAYTIPVLWNGRRLAGLAQELPADRQTLPWSATWLSMLPIIFTFWLADFLGNFFYLIDRYMLINLLDEASETVLSQIGNYEAAHVLPLVYLAVTGWIAKTLMPYLAKSWETGAREDVISQVLFSIKLVGFGSVFSGLLLVGFSDGLFTLLFAGKYGAAVPLLPYTILFYIGCGTTTLLMNYFWCIGQARWAMLALVVGCLANVGINWVAIPPHGILGAAWGTTCGIIGQVLVLLAVAWVFGLRADLGVGLLGLSTLLLFTPEQWIFASLMGLVVALALPGVWVADDRRRIRAAAEKIFARFSPSR